MKVSNTHYLTVHCFAVGLLTLIKHKRMNCIGTVWLKCVCVYFYGLHLTRGHLVANRTTVPIPLDNPIACTINCSIYLGLRAGHWRLRGRILEAVTHLAALCNKSTTKSCVSVRPSGLSAWVTVQFVLSTKRRGRNKLQIGHRLCQVLSGA